MEVLYTQIYTNEFFGERVPFPSPADSPTLMLTEVLQDCAALLSRIGRFVNHELLRMRLAKRGGKVNRMFIVAYLQEMQLHADEMLMLVGEVQNPETRECIVKLRIKIREAMEMAENKSHRYTTYDVNRSSFELLCMIENLLPAPLAADHHYAGYVPRTELGKGKYDTDSSDESGSDD